MKYFGLLMLVACICISFNIQKDDIRTLHGIIIDRYKGVAAHEESDEDGSSTYYTDDLYLVVKYNEIGIERQSVEPNQYYTHKIGDKITEVRNFGRCTGYRINILLIVVAIVLIIIGFIYNI